MAGLLGNLDDPQNMGMLQLAAGLLGTGSFGDQVGRGLQGYQAAQMNALAQQKDKMQMDMLRQQVEQATRKNTLINNYLTGLTGGSPSVASTGATAGDAQSSPQPGMFNGVPSSAIGADLALNDGKNIGEWLYKQGVPDMQVVGGYAFDKNKVQPGFMPGLDTSANGQTSLRIPDGKGGVIVSAPQGAVDTFMGYKAGDAPVEIPLSNGQKASLFPAEIAAYQRTGKLPDRLAGTSTADAPKVPTSSNGAALSTGLRDFITNDAKNNGNGSPVTVNFTGAKPGQMYDLQRAGQTAAPSKPTFGLTQSPTDAGKDKAIAETAGLTNSAWLKSSYEPVIAAGQAAQGVIESTSAARDAMRKMGGTGWGTENKAAAANVLSGLGIASNNAQLYAANAQVFQKAAAERLWAVLNNAKGAQTDRDASRAQQTYAQLGNTPQANEFILDMAQATAERDKAKAAFYDNALPIAKAKGDLTEVSREWSKRMPSIFDMPIMQRWKK